MLLRLQLNDEITGACNKGKRRKYSPTHRVTYDSLQGCYTQLEEAAHRFLDLRPSIYQACVHGRVRTQRG